MPDCAFLLDNGRPCGCPALHDDPFCRHHTPAALARRRLRTPSGEARSQSRLASEAAPDRPQEPAADPGQAPEWTPGVLKAYWKSQHRILATADAAACDEIFEMVLGALDDHDISHRSAGRLLQAILDRRKILNREAQEAAIRAAEQQLRQRQAEHLARVRAWNAAHPATPAPTSRAEALTTAAVPTPAHNPPSSSPAQRL